MLGCELEQAPGSRDGANEGQKQEEAYTWETPSSLLIIILRHPLRKAAELGQAPAPLLLCQAGSKQRGSSSRPPKPILDSHLSLEVVAKEQGKYNTEIRF